MKIALFLITTFIIDEKSELFKNKFLTNNEKRLNQYIDGINSIKFFKGDIYLLDNSSNLENLPNKLKILIKSIPNLKYINNTENKLGKINKTAGIIDVWKKNINLFEKYDFIIHFEPRQKVVDNSFFTKIGNYFYIDKTGIQFHTGLFTLDSQSFIQFIKDSNLEIIIKEKQQLERLLFQFMENRKYNRVDKLGIIWYDSHKKDKEVLI